MASMTKQDVADAQLLDSVAVNELPVDPIAETEAPQSPQAPSAQFIAENPPLVNCEKHANNRQGTVPVPKAPLGAYAEKSPILDLGVVQGAAQPLNAQSIPQKPPVVNRGKFVDHRQGAVVEPYAENALNPYLNVVQGAVQPLNAQFVAHKPAIPNRENLAGMHQGTRLESEAPLGAHAENARTTDVNVLQGAAQPLGLQCDPHQPSTTNRLNVTGISYSTENATLGDARMLFPSATNPLTAAASSVQEALQALNVPVKPHQHQISNVQDLASNGQGTILADDVAYNSFGPNSRIEDFHVEKEGSQAVYVRMVPNQPPVENRSITDGNFQGTSADDDMTDLTTVSSLPGGPIAENTTPQEPKFGLNRGNQAGRIQDHSSTGVIRADEETIDLTTGSSLVPMEMVKKEAPQHSGGELVRNNPVDNGGAGRFINEVIDLTIENPLPPPLSKIESKSENVVGSGKSHCPKGGILADGQTDDEMIDLIAASSITTHAAVKKEAAQSHNVQPEAIFTGSSLTANPIVKNEGLQTNNVQPEVIITGSSLTANAIARKEALRVLTIQPEILIKGCSIPANTIAKNEALQPFKADPMLNQPPLASHHYIAGSGQIQSNLDGIYGNHHMMDILLQNPQTANAAAGQEAVQQLNPQSNSGILPGPPHTPVRSGKILRDDEIDKLLTLNSLTADATAEEETPQQLNVELMPHQRRAVKWMAKRENLPETHQGYSCEGGILADDQGLGKTLTMLALLFHNTEEGKPWKTLVVCPFSLVSQWKGEIETRVNEQCKKSVYVYHGAKRTKYAYDLKEYDFVITTYQTLAHDYKNKELLSPSRRGSAPFNLKWNRIVLDEAHTVKNRRTGAWKAVAELDAKFRWCLTGTPIQNSVNDLFSLLMFIKYEFVPDVETWNRKWKSKLENQSPKIRERAFTRFQAILGPVLLRRTKNDRINGKPIIILPKRDVVVLEETLQDEEVELYKAVEKKAIITFNKFLMAGTVLRNYSNVLTLLLRLRQAVCHPFLIQYCDMKNGGDGEEKADVQSIKEIVRMGSKVEEEVSEEEDPDSDDDDFIDDRSEEEISNDLDSKKSEDEMDIEDEISNQPRRTRKRSRIIVSDSVDEDFEDESARKISKFVVISDIEDDVGENGRALKRSGGGIENGNPRKRFKCMVTSDIEADSDAGAKARELSASPVISDNDYVQEEVRTENNVLVPGTSAQHVGVGKVENEIVDLTGGDDVSVNRDELQKNFVKQEGQMLGAARSAQHGGGAKLVNTFVALTGDDHSELSGVRGMMPKNAAVKQEEVNAEYRIMESTTSTQHNGVVKTETAVASISFGAGGVQPAAEYQEKTVVKQEIAKMEDAILPAPPNAQHSGTVGTVKMDNAVVDLTDDDNLLGKSEVLPKNGIVKQELTPKKKNKKEAARDMRDVVMRPSRKITVLIAKLKETRDEDPGRKSLVFSQWTSCMDIISCHLDKEGIEYCRLDGSMNMKKRSKEIKLFQTDAKKKVFLISLMAGGTGLNLTCASQVFLFDVWWNPAVEEQAIDRAHRIGQSRDVRVFKFRMMNTIEDRIYKVCAFKKETSDGALGIAGKQTPGRRKLSLDELRLLFTTD